MGFHAKGEPSSDLFPFQFEKAQCVYCYEDIDPNEGWVWWHGVSISTAEVGVVFLHASCAVEWGGRLITDGNMALGKYHHGHTPERLCETGLLTY